MPVRMLNFLKNPLPKRVGFGRRSLVLETEEWREMEKVIAAGLKPQEYISITIPENGNGDGIWSEFKYPLQTLLHNVRAQVKKRDLPYDVIRRGDQVIVLGRGVLS